LLAISHARAAGQPQAGARRGASAPLLWLP